MSIKVVMLEFGRTINEEGDKIFNVKVMEKIRLII